MTAVKIVTHNGKFHPDELFAVATILLILDQTNTKYEIVRTRDKNEIAGGDFVLDVGGVYDPDKNKFDHHQIGGAGKRENGIPYATFGLVWKKFGLQLCSDQKVVDRIDRKLVQSIDADDNAVRTFTPLSSEVKPYQLEDAISAFLPTWTEKDQNIDLAFLKVLVLVEEILARKIKKAGDFFLGEKRVLAAYEKAEDKRVIVLDDEYSWKETLSKFPEPLFVVANDGRRPEWAVSTVRESPDFIKSRKLFPESWAGRKDKELSEITGVNGALFCHNGRHLVMAKDFQSAMELANIAVES
jgi:uncharacterized UPF0160 family protein